MKKVSVLVAVYNAAATLQRCLDSLLAQTYPDIEVVCADDASTDGSLQVLKDYASRDSRIQVVREETNLGAPHARNEALRHATGDFICFLDSDDWLASDAIEQCVKVFERDEEIDCVLFNVILTDADGQQQQPYPTPPLEHPVSGEEALRRSLDWQLHGVYMIKADIHRRIPYDESSQLYSDDNTTRYHYHASRKVAQADARYYYRQHALSATHQTTARRYQQIDAAQQMQQWLADNHVADDIQRAYHDIRWRIIIDTYLFHFCHRQQLSKAERRQGLQKIRHAWRTTDPQLITPALRKKFGYMPIKRSWVVFRLQEEVYFTLRTLLGKNRK